MTDESTLAESGTPVTRAARVRALVVAAVVGLLAVPLLATPASAAPTAQVNISQLTAQFVVSVDAGGTVTFVNTIPAKSSVLGLVTVYTDVTVRGPAGSVAIPSGQSRDIRFDSSYVGLVTPVYRAAGLLGVLDALPALPAPQPLIVNTILPLPNLPVPPVNVPNVPAPNLPLPGVPETNPNPVPDPDPNAPPGPTTGAPPPIAGAPTPGGPTTTTPGTGLTIGEQIMPGGSGLSLGAPDGFDPRRSGSSSGLGGSGTAGTPAGGYDGAQAPVFGVLDGLDEPLSTGPTTALPTDVEEQDDLGALPRAIGVPALIAILILSIVSAGLVRTTLISRQLKKATAAK